MSIFNRNFNKPGPGVPKDAPQKKGIKLFLRVMSEDAGDLFKLNVLFSALTLPSLCAYLLWLLGITGILSLVLSIILAIPVGGALASCFFCIAKMLRDEPGDVTYDFKRKFKENIKQAAIPGMLYAAFIYAQIYQTSLIASGAISIDAFMLAVIVLTPLLVGMLMQYIFLQIAHIELKVTHMFSNSILLLLSNIPRSIMGTVTGGIVYIAFIIFYPQSLFIIPAILLFYGFSLPWLLNLMWVWPVVDNKFSISENLRKR